MSDYRDLATLLCAADCFADSWLENPLSACLNLNRTCGPTLRLRGRRPPILKAEISRYWKPKRAPVRDFTSEKKVRPNCRAGVGSRISYRSISQIVCDNSASELEDRMKGTWYPLLEIMRRGIPSGSAEYRRELARTTVARVCPVFFTRTLMVGKEPVVSSPG